MFDEHMLFFVPSRIGISYKVKKSPTLCAGFFFAHSLKLPTYIHVMATGNPFQRRTFEHGRYSFLFMRKLHKKVSTASSASESLQSLNPGSFCD